MHLILSQYNRSFRPVRLDAKALAVFLLALTQFGHLVLGAEDAVFAKLFLGLGLGEILLEDLWVAHGVEVGVALRLLCGQTFLAR